MSLYIFAIGGSGSRVLRSLTMLLSAGVTTTSEKIIPIIIDPDAANGDMNRTTELLRDYQNIRSKFRSNNTKHVFFSTEINSLNDDNKYLLQLEGTQGTPFETYLGLSSMSEENQAFAKMLFSNANLASSMDVGFKGNPNIGSVVLNQIAESPIFQGFCQNFSSNDKVFIISSIFGGTGASGFPLLLKSLRESSNIQLRDAPIGAVTLLPYFNLQEDETSEIKADSFMSKTKAALSYYYNNVTGNKSLDDMYYLGDDYKNASYKNCEGGDNQQNDAHLIELLAALAIIDFDQRGHDRSSHSTAFHEFGLKTETENLNGAITFDDFGDETCKTLVKPMAMTAIMHSYLTTKDKEHIYSQKWSKENKNRLGETFFKSQHYKTYESFMRHYEEWIEELKTNELGFDPFNADKEISNDGLTKVKNIHPEYSGIFFKKKGFDLVDDTLNGKCSNLKNGLDANCTFFEIFYDTLQEICKKNLKIE